MSPRSRGTFPPGSSEAQRPGRASLDTLPGEGRTRSVRGGASLSRHPPWGGSDAQASGEGMLGPACLENSKLSAVSPLRAFGSTLPEGECRFSRVLCRFRSFKYDPTGPSSQMYAQIQGNVGRATPSLGPWGSSDAQRPERVLSLDTLLGEGRTRSVRGGDVGARMSREFQALRGFPSPSLRLDSPRGRVSFFACFVPFSQFQIRSDWAELANVRPNSVECGSRAASTPWGSSDAQRPGRCLASVDTLPRDLRTRSVRRGA